MSRLTEKLAKAAGVAPRLGAKIEARADALIAREPEIEAKADRTFSPHERILDEHHQDLDALDNALNQMTNGGPALEEDHTTPMPHIRGYPS